MHDATDLINRVTKALIEDDATGMAQALNLLMQEHPQDARDVLAIFGRRMPEPVMA
jgi:hypothetical protein